MGPFYLYTVNSILVLYGIVFILMKYADCISVIETKCRWQISYLEKREGRGEEGSERGNGQAIRGTPRDMDKAGR
jgi:hypothetical protein